MERSSKFVGEIAVSPLDQPSTIRLELARNGLCLFCCDSGATRSALLAVAGEIGRVHLHPHGDTDGVTTIAPNGEWDGQVAAAGFTHNGLDPHTDASTIIQPPAFLLNGCVKASGSGGATLLTDMRAVYTDLAKNDPETLAVFSNPGSMIFGTGPSAHVGSVFEEFGDRIRVRFRMDESGLVPATSVDRFVSLLAVIQRNTIMFDLAPGFGYIVDNHWWLHGRTAFRGDREVVRVLAQTRDDDRFGSGFSRQFNNLLQSAA